MYSLKVSEDWFYAYAGQTGRCVCVCSVGWPQTYCEAVPKDDTDGFAADRERRRIEQIHLCASVVIGQICINWFDDLYGQGRPFSD